jgi:hypothetical protein
LRVLARQLALNVEIAIGSELTTAANARLAKGPLLGLMFFHT